ncbi:hypothetical protein DPEC_G00174550 [Dallia pectoralis]|uniref:Uncharacterized protein n=1 Tax=Dallia pectoralis TaxID=75939 RepID=A0ACC2GDW5_DALPE|nr:hypothetical protein DPEC_G00174550 [Dallia pectoralis]
MDPTRPLKGSCGIRHEQILQAIEAYRKVLRETCEKFPTMPQTESDPTGLRIGTKTLSGGKPKYKKYSCNGSLDTRATDQRSTQAPGQPWLRRKLRKKSKNPLPYVYENWEEEIKMVEESVLAPYGPEDVALQELKLAQTPGSPQIAADYLPSTHHQAPISWVRHINHAVREQFDDAEN